MSVKAALRMGGVIGFMLVMLISLAACKPNEAPPPTNATESTVSTSPSESPALTNGPVVTLEPPEPPPSEPADVSITGLLATVPGYAAIDSRELAALATEALGGEVPSVRIQTMVLLTPEDEAFLVVALEGGLDGFISAGTVEGVRTSLPTVMPQELDFLQGVIVTDKVVLMEPVTATPEQVNQNPTRYAFQRVALDTTHLLSSTRVKDAPPSLDRLGFGLATDAPEARSRDAFLSVLDPYNTEAQLRVARVTGTVLYPTPTVRELLGRLYQFGPDDLTKALDGPSVFYESVEDDKAKLLTIRELVPRLDQYHGQIVSVEGMALGKEQPTEEIYQLRNLPLHFTLKAIGIADNSGPMPIIGISSENTSRVIAGSFRFDLSVYRFGDGQSYAFLIHREAIRKEFYPPSAPPEPPSRGSPPDSAPVPEPPPRIGR